MTRRREFVAEVACAAVAPVLAQLPTEKGAGDALDLWQRETDLVSAKTYGEYLRDGDTRGFATLEKLERGFEKILHETEGATIGDVPAVWNVYNMGYVVKTREALFSIDLVHRRAAAELAPRLDFALITHNHLDHYLPDFYRAMDGAGKTVISNFLDNYGVRNWKKDGGFTRAVKTFKIKDVEIRTSLIDHNDYLIDFTTAFEIRIGSFVLYHTGDSGRGTENKLGTVWGRPDLWLFFPGCGINVAKAVQQVQPKRIVCGHLWELSHVTGRLTAPMVRRALANATPACENVSAALWGDRVL